MNDLEKANIIVAHCEQMGVNLCNGFDNWTTTAFALSTLGEAGRDLFHRLARMDEAYKEIENEKKFANAMRTNRRISFATFLHHAEQCGVNVRELLNRSEHAAHEFKERGKLPTVAVRRVAPAPVDNIPINLIERSQGTLNALCQYLCGLLGEHRVDEAVKRYRVGSTRQGETIFPQIDRNGNCRTAKVVAYDANSGHRIKERGADWLHSRWMKMQGKTSADYNLLQCLFGEHLLVQFPTATVCIVEAEKTAFLCSMIWTDVVWVATGGIQGFTEERLFPLATRKVLVFPDADAYACWQEKTHSISFASSWTFSNWSANEPEGSKRDIADIILEQIASEKQQSPEARLAELRRKNKAIDLLCSRFELVVVS